MQNTPWRPTPFVTVSFVLHLVSALLWLYQPSWWYWSVLILVLNHIAICIVSLLPRSTWLGKNLVRLPADAISRGEIVLTFDDGPDPEVTPKVLEILQRYGVKASFFCIGQRALAHPEICRQIIAAGHTIQNHGQLHRNHYSLLGFKGWLREVGQAQDTIQQITGQSPKYFRALAGLRNPFLDPALHQLDMQLASWTRRGYDTRTGDADLVLQRLTHQLAAGDILLMHDGNAARTPQGQAVVLSVLPRLLDEIHQRNLKPITL